MRIVAATGFGPAARRPEWLMQRRIKRVVEAVVKELTQGIGETDSRAGVITLLAPTPDDEAGDVLRVIGAAHQKTSAPVIVYAPDRRTERLDALEEAGVPAHCVALSHAGVGASIEELTALAQRGASLIFADWGIAARVNDADLVGLLRQLQSAGLADRLMVSVDFAFRIRHPDAIEWPLFGVPGRTHAYQFRSVLPMLRGAGFSEGDLWQLMVANPAALLAHGGQRDEPCPLCGR